MGDVYDLRYLRGKASEDDHMDQQAQADLDAGDAFLSEFRPTTWLLGNHDWRAVKAMESPSPLKRMAGQDIYGHMTDAAGKDCRIIPYNKRAGVHRLGDVKFLHGYSTGIGGVRKHALIYGRCVIGHLHVVESVTVERLDAPTCWCIGTLSRLELGYNEQHIGTLRQGHGFAYGTVVGGRTSVVQVRFNGMRMEEQNGVA